MFISLNDLKGLIVDIDTIPEELDDEWNEVTESSVVVFFGEDDYRLSTLSSKYPKAKTLNKSPFSSLFSIKRSIYSELLRTINLDSYETALVTGSVNHVKRVIDFNISTIQYNEGEETNYDLAGFLPDFEISDIDDLMSIINGESTGYFSEVHSIRGGIAPSGSTSSVIVTEKVSPQNNRYAIISGGRYFNTHDARSKGHQLSKRILENKDPRKSQDEIFIPLYKALINYTHTKRENIDGITRIPPKLSETYDRFEALLSKISRDLGVDDYSSKLTCVKKYKSQKECNELERKENVKNAFSVSGNVRGKHIVLVDDIITTGATVSAAVDELYRKGARKVTVVVLAINQQSSHLVSHYLKPLRCDQCDAEMGLRINSNDQSAFFGCSNFFKAGCKNSMNYQYGIKQRNIDSKFTLADEEDDEFEF